MRNNEVFDRLQKLIKYMPRQKELAEKTGIIIRHLLHPFC